MQTKGSVVEKGDVMPEHNDGIHERIWTLPDMYLDEETMRQLRESHEAFESAKKHDRMIVSNFCQYYQEDPDDLHENEFQCLARSMLGMKREM